MPAQRDLNPQIAAVCLVFIALISGAMTVFFPRFSCFYELHGIDDYTLEMTAGIFGSCCFFSLLAVVLWLKWPYSKGVMYFSQVTVIVFVLGTSLFGICVFSMMQVAAGELEKSHNSNEGKNSSWSTSFVSSAPIRAVQKLLSPDRDLDADWIHAATVAAQTSNESTTISNSSPSGSAFAKTADLCRLQQQFQCIMWRGSDTCVLTASSSSPSSSSSNTTSSPSFGSSVPSVLSAQRLGAGSDDSKQQQQQIPCLTCGIFTVNLTAGVDRPLSCFAAIVDCFAHGREKYGTSLREGTKYSYSADRFVMIIGSIMLLLLGVVAFWKNLHRKFTVPGGYGEYEHGVDYKPLQSGVM